MKPFYSNCIIELSHQLCSHDETELALKALDLVPAYYRDHRIEELEILRSNILKRMQLPIDLTIDDRESPKPDHWNKQFLRSTARGQLLESELKSANEKNIVPHIVEYGAGDFTFCLALCSLGYSFHYFNYGLNLSASDKLKQKLPADIKWVNPEEAVYTDTWFVAYEIIEHLADPREIRSICDRFITKPEKIFLSTPKYCFSDGTDWEKDGIHHRRAYTPGEFTREAIDIFPQYDLKFKDADVMCIIGNRRGS